MDLGTIVGFAAGTLLIAIAIALGGTFSAFLDLPSLFIVLGGGLSAACVMFPAEQLLGAVKVAAKAFRFRRTSPERLIRRLVAMAEVVRREGLLALEKEEFEHEFLRRGLNLAIDGTDSETIDVMLVTEIQALRRRHQQGQKIFRALDLQETGNLYDIQDAFFVPYAGFRGVERPGPNFTLFRRAELVYAGHPGR